MTRTAGPGVPLYLLILGRDVEPSALRLAAFEQESLLFVATQHEMRGSRKHAFDAGEFLRDERRHLLQRLPLHEDQQVVPAGHEITRLHFVEARDPFRETIEPASAFGGYFDLDHRAHGGGSGGLTREIEHRTPAEEDFIFLQLLQMLLNFGFGNPRDLRHLGGREARAFDQKLENRVHRGRVYPANLRL